MSADALKAITTLFDQGLADPRGCEYCEIQVVVGSCWGGSGIVKTHGWVLPTKSAQQFAVCWSGLVYPCTSVGKPADLDQDVRTMLAKDEAQIGQTRAHFDQSEKIRRLQAKQTGETYNHIDWPVRWDARAKPEAEGVADDVLLPTKAALVLRLGEGRMASEMWSEWFGVKLQSQTKDPYLLLANAWAWSLFDRAVCAHMRGDDHLAWASEQLLATIAPKIEEEAGARNLSKPMLWPGGKKAASPYLTFLDQLPDLEADDQRRTEETPYRPVLQNVFSPAGAERIDALIHDLELVSARQWGQPGGVSLGGDPIVVALIKCGDPAVEPLLHCLETDTRFTRSVHFGRDFFQSRTVIGVPEAAYVALAGILQTDFFGVASTSDSLTAHGTKGRQEVAAAIRAYWLKNKGLTLEERWYATLKDDHSPAGQWLEAAANITQEVDVQVERTSMFGGWVTTPNRQPGQTVPMRGESLRARTKPSVSDLLVSRMQALAAPMNQSPDTNLDDRVQLALALAKWDGKAHFTELSALTDDVQKAMASSAAEMNLPLYLLRLFHARVEAGDPQALANYAFWIPTNTREKVPFGGDSILDLMWQHPTDPTMQAAARKLFGSLNTPWVPLYKAPDQPDQYFTSPLVGMKEFRAELLRGLTDTSVVGTLLIGSDGSANPNVPGLGGWGGVDTAKHDPLAPPANTDVHFRVCDLYAHELSRLDCAPRCQLYWPLAKRDAAVQACAAFLQRFGDLYQYRAADDNDPTNFLHQARIHFPELNAPATPDDVRHNRAIFSLEGQRRVWKLPNFPMNATWTSLKEVVQEQQYWSMNGKAKVELSFDNQGQVFQAEEEFVNGKWRRWFGFAGAHHIAKVPASEIEFRDSQWTTLSHGFQAEVLAPGESEKNDIRTGTKLAVSQPLMLVVNLRNASGIEQTIPRAVLKPANASSLALPAGIDLKLLYSPQTDQDPRTLPDSDWQPGRWLRKVASTRTTVDGPALAPTKQETVLKINLRDFFDFSKPGSYQVQVSFTDSTGIKGEELPGMFVLP